MFKGKGWFGESHRHRLAQLKRFRNRVEVIMVRRSGKKDIIVFLEGTTKQNLDRAIQYVKQLSPRFIHNAWIQVNGEVVQGLNYWNLR